MTTTQATAPECQVLVVGAGPTGLTLAAQLLAMGVRTRVIDKGEGPVLQSRALGIHARTLELLDTMDLAEAFLDQGHQVRRVRMYAGTRNLLDLDLARNGSRFGFVLHLPQSQTETLLRARVRELGGTIEHRVELVRVEERGDVVDATLRDVSGLEIHVNPGYVVGCDGAHSRVRHEIGLPFEGQPYPQDWLLADVALDGAGSDDAVHAFFRPDGLPLVCIPMGGRRWRVVMANAGDRGDRPPTFADIQALVADRAPRPIEVADPAWLASFRCQLRSTTSYRRGRVLLAGDAAHIHSPAGGQGMNTGMMDAHNLAWKLALVAEGRAPDALLDTYGQERGPVASGVLEFTDRLVGLLTMRNRAKRAVRDTVIPIASRLPAAQRRGARKLSQVSVACPSSPLIEPGGHRRGPKPGDRLPDVQIRTQHGPAPLYRLLGSRRHVLIVSGPRVRVAFEAAGLHIYSDLVDVVDGDPKGAFALVRPDGILAVRGSGSETRRVLDYLQRLGGEVPPSWSEHGAPPIKADILQP
ncbi:FAD-binding monooxygenase [Nocardioides gansuensis]|uniref:FAD-binding monooxygenase n=1 Tax=Nocardioides gansuensis TaxID=2138300 RepID=A0A2T8FFP0_9ACTN|nr:FAD-dependent monooxygenase [Nocardioides gansuensis]PVG84533.1 FAD-binding monooxygenase [Nocardioides gansuensis]